MNKSLTFSCLRGTWVATRARVAPTPRVDSVLYRATLQPALQWGRARVLAIPREGPALVEDLSLGVAVVLNALLIGGYDAAGTWPAAVTCPGPRLCGRLQRCCPPPPGIASPDLSPKPRGKG